MIKLHSLLLLFGFALTSYQPQAFADTDVIGIQPQHLHAEYWQLKQEDAQTVLLNELQINALNQRSFKQQEELQNLSELPARLSADALKAAINQISTVPSSDRFFADGTKLSSADYQRYLDNLNVAAIKPQNAIRFALVTERTNMRRFPSAEKTYNQAMDLDIDRFIETGLFPGDALAIFHESKDGQWYLARAYHYLAWLPKSSVALGSKEEVLGYGQQAPFVVVTGAKVFTNYNPQAPQLSEKQLDMGVRMPLLDNQSVKHYLYGQNPYASYVVKLPYREESGQLSFKPALISRNQDLHQGYLPFNKANIIQQGFKFLGERYGWGHDYNARDCTGFVSEIYRTFGILMPRNSGEQGNGAFGQNIRFDADSPVQDKLNALKELQVGDLIYIPGHVVMYLGEEQGQPYVIHDVHGMSYVDEQGNYYQGGLNGVSVTPLLPLHLSKSTSYLDRIYTIKSVR
ncbi:SH3 domain-containing protein [Bowmanella sp. Y26]|uniref:NlpC/P60 family protein n=1 Tax=Bowmanella yangjiangensis TaxID=2811230 RepID=UPI001BDC5E8B|nr:NlpC/P60 family protein [Bowmanella yangjiangensis]MBT1064873.1 SH3 domain-containing protein [Bowmanella yangjiangensis]